jgi:hypothetical protein
MKNTSKFLPLVLTLLVAMFQLTSLPEARAFGGAPGGPFSNGSYFPNDGTFSAVVRGENMSGTVQFSTTAGSGTTQAGSTGVSTIFYDGDTFIGNSQGAYNPQASTMTVNFQADVEGQGQQRSVAQELVVTEIQPNPNTGVPDETISLAPTTQVLYFDALYLSGSAECKATNAFPNQKFSGSGEAEFQQLEFSGNKPFLDAVRVPITITGVRLSNTANTFATATVRPPSFNQFSLIVQ